METVLTNEDTGKGVMWELEKSLDQPMDAEAGRLRNMYTEKLYDISGKSPEVHLNTKMSIDAILSCMY
ncbi:hypothetical protein ZWY2020_035356 [Hordeum vulgare]|nr:hypothetical protein ZWY2020_035356 [Hordeum vulgare]